MKKRTTHIKRYLLVFCAWLGVSVAAFYVLNGYYANLVLLFSEYLLIPFTTVAVELQNVAGRGIALSYPGIKQPLGFRVDLFSVTLNFIFVPALVLTTVTLAVIKRAIVRIVLAILVILLLHAYHVALIILHFLTQAPNPLIAADFPTFLMTFIHWNYTFADKMGYTLFPFIAWFSVCFMDVVRILAPADEPAGDSDEEQEIAV